MITQEVDKDWGKISDWRPYAAKKCKYCGTVYATKDYRPDAPFVCENCELITNAGAI